MRLFRGKMSKKITTLVLLAVGGLAAFLAGYLASRHPAIENRQATLDNSLISRFEETAEKHAPPSGLFLVSKDKAAFPKLSANGREILYYNPESGDIRSVSASNLLGGSATIAKIHPGANQISWGQNKTLMASYINGSTYYDLINSGFSKKLDNKIKNPVFSRAGDKVAYVWFDEGAGTGSVGVANPTFENFKSVMPTRFGNWQLGWLNAKTLYIIKIKPATLENPLATLFTLNVETKALEKILDSKNNLEMVPAADGKKLLYSYTDSYSGETNLYTTELANNQETPLNIPGKASSCAWSVDNNTIYCARADSFFAVDTSLPDQSPRKLTKPGQGGNFASINNLILTSSEDYLIFVNTRDERLYGLGLGK